MMQGLPFSPIIAPADLSNCDLEPIHIPSSIQPHGLLIAARQSDLRIIYASENSSEIIGISASVLLSKTVNEVLGSQVVSSIEEALGSEQYVPANILTCPLPACGVGLFDVSAHRMGTLLCLELEPALQKRRWDLLAIRIEKAIRSLGRPETLESLCAAIAPLIRSITGYDRVMVYRFDADGHGEVIEENKAAHLEPFLGLHYPATDIPQQARRLYLLQRIRTIVDVNYRPVRVLGHPQLTHEQPLDMTYCGLRSVSPIHIEYLQNMGVGASLGISLIHRNELWGMILCHHSTTMYVLPEVRALCDLLGRLISLLIGVTLQTQEYAERLSKKALVGLIADLLKDKSSIMAALEEHAGLSKAITGADGVALRIEGQTKLMGRTPSLNEALAIMSALDSKLTHGVYSCDELGAVFPEFAHLAATASGTLMIRFREAGDAMLWFRGEVTRSVHWAGENASAKQPSEGAVRMSPRKSFASWKEVQHGRSLVWMPGEISAAIELQHIVVDALLKRTETEMAQLSELSSQLEGRVMERTQALHQSLLDKETLLKEVHHRVKNNLQVICSLLSLQLDAEGESPASASLRDAYERVNSISLVHEQIYHSETLADLDLGDYVKSLASHLYRTYCTDPDRIELSLNTESVHLLIDQAVPCGLILNELISNALKHAFPDGRTGLVKVELHLLSNGSVEMTVADNGVGLKDGFTIESAGSMGMQVIHILAGQLSATLDISNDQGSRFTLRWMTPHV